MSCLRRGQQWGRDDGPELPGLDDHRCRALAMLATWPRAALARVAGAELGRSSPGSLGAVVGLLGGMPRPCRRPRPELPGLGAGAVVEIEGIELGRAVCPWRCSAHRAAGASRAALLGALLVLALVVEGIERPAVLAPLREPALSRGRPWARWRRAGTSITAAGSLGRAVSGNSGKTAGGRVPWSKMPRSRLRHGRGHPWAALQIERACRPSPESQRDAARM